MTPYDNPQDRSDQRTRAFEPTRPETRRQPTTAMPRPDRTPTYEEAEPPKKGLLGDLSLPQVVAGALAAVTSMLLSNKIGIAGSVIGVAVGSVVSAVSSAVYKRLIASSAHRIKEMVSTNGPDSEPGAEPAFEPEPELEPTGTRIAPQELRDRAKKARRDRNQKLAVGAVAVAVVSALVGVGIYAAFVTFATKGEGIGTKAPIVAVAPRRDQAENAPSDKTDATQDQNAEGSQQKPQDGAAQDKPSGSQDPSSSDPAGGTSGTGTGSSQGTGSGQGSQSGTAGGQGTSSGTDAGSGSGSQATGSGDGGASEGGSSQPSAPSTGVQDAAANSATGTAAAQH